MLINKNFTAVINRDSNKIRTCDPNIKSVMLYQLSYGIINKNSRCFTTAATIIDTLEKSVLMDYA